MRVSNDEKERSRARIVSAAGNLFRRFGVQGASLGDIMNEAGMTHGGFYRHFADKDALVAAALQDAFDRFAKPLTDGPESGAARDAFRQLYLSVDHLATPGQGCPAAALGPDIARASEPVRAAFRDGLNRMIEGLMRARHGEADPKTHAIRDLAMLVGAMVLARAAGGGMANDILAACATPPD